MKSLFGLFVILISLLFNLKSAFAFDYAPEIGDLAPSFNLEGINKSIKSKKIWDSNELKGKWLVLYFYPKDFSSGCTLEAKNFQDNLSKYNKINASIVGISADSEEEHESFCTSEKLGYTLLSDANSEISKSYDSWLDPYSKRNTFLINPEGIVVYKWIGVRPIGHAQEVLEELIKQQKIYA